MLIIFLLVAGFCLSTIPWSRKESEERLLATNMWCDASEAFVDWRIRNQGVYIGLSEKGRKLLARNLETFDEFCRTHPSFKGSEHREWLVSLFCEFPPKEPDDVPESEIKDGLQAVLLA